MVEWIIDDDKLFSDFSLNKDSSFNEFIKNISDYAYQKIELEQIFKIEDKLKSLLECELFLSITKKRHRDHLLHACRIAHLGEIILTEKLIYKGKSLSLLDLVRELYNESPEIVERFALFELEISNKNILKIWYIGALFHDIGFIYEAFKETAKNIEILWSIKDFRKLHLDIQNAIHEFESGFSDDNRMHGRSMNIFDHAKTGGCIIYNLLGDNNLICEMAASMAECHTASNLILFSKDPLSFLLILLDEIQEWERPAAGRKLLEEALSEPIGKFSPFIETNIKPELNNIKVSLSINEVNPDKSSLNLGFLLEYEDDIELQDETNFSFPIMLYLKYKNFQRLRIGDKGEIEKAFKKCCDDGTSLDLNMKLTMKTSGVLAYKWHRQCDALLFKSLRSKNKTLIDWLYEETKYKEKQGVVSYTISTDRPLPRVFSGNFMDVLLEAHNDYLNTLYLSIDDFRSEYIYSPSENPSEMKLLIKHKRTLINSRKDIPITGFYVAIDDEIRDIQLINVGEDGRSITNKVEKYEIKKDPDDDVRIFEESFAFYTPFETPMRPGRGSHVTDGKPHIVIRSR